MLSVKSYANMLATATDSELKESDVEEDKDELEENKLVLEDCHTMCSCNYCTCILSACFDAAIRITRFVHTLLEY